MTVNCIVQFFVRDGILSVADYDSTRVGVVVVVVVVVVRYFLSVADLSATDYGIAVECSLSVCVSVSTIKIY